MSRQSNFEKKSTVKSPFVAPVKKILRKYCLSSVCEAAHCPNIGECFKKKTATFLIMGNRCTRNCRFCNIEETKEPFTLDSNEPANVARAVHELGLRYVVITSVTRDDLLDGGAEHFAKVVKELRNSENPPLIEILTPDFKGNEKAFDIIVEAAPDVFNHNVETVERLYSAVRPQADYVQSLNMLKYMKEKGLTTKSGIMTGLGETFDEIKKVIDDIAAQNCDILTVGQYFKPSKQHAELVKEYTEEEFEEIKNYALKTGIKDVYAGRFVRSSFNAMELYETINKTSEK